MYKIVFLDIDGTILPPNHIIPVSTKEAVSKLQQQGIEVVIATGRPIIDTVKVANELGIDSYITFNGAHASYKGEILFQKHILKEDVEFISSVSEKHQHGLMYLTEDKNYISAETSVEVINYVDHLQMHYTVVTHKEDLQNVFAVTTVVHEAEDASYYENNPNIRLVKCNIKDFVAYDIISPSVNKGTAIKTYLEHLNIKPSEAVAFGDGMNDKEMLSFVGMGIAMGNCTPDLHPYAKFITTSVSDNGIWNGLKKINLV